MKSKILWLILLILIIGCSVYFKHYYVGSESYLERNFQSIIAMPIDHYYNTVEKSCGIWYENESNPDFTTGRGNDDVKGCFAKAFEHCVPAKVLFVNNNNAESMIYSMIRIIRKNDAGACLIQNYFEQTPLVVEGGLAPEPIIYINTCTALSEDVFNSCQPEYLKKP